VSIPAEHRENKMGVMPINRLLISMSLPMMLSMLVQALYNVVDSIYVAQISEDALTAVGLAFPAQNLMISVGVGTGVGINAFLSKNLGEKNFETANKTANQAILLAFLSWVAFAVAGTLFSRPFIAVQTSSAVIAELGAEYMSIVIIACVGSMFQICFERLLQSTGKTIYSMLVQGVGAIINIVMDPILIFGLGPIPAMGVAGAAWATVLGQIVGAILGLIFNLKVNHEITLSFKSLKPEGAIIKKIYAVGVPSIIMSSIGSVMTFGMNKLLDGISSTAQAVFTAYFKLQSFVFMPVFGLNNGIVPIVAYNYGARHPDRIKKTVKLGALYGLAIMCAGILLFWLIPEVLLGFFNASEHMLELGVPALRLISLCFPFAAVGIVASSCFQALGHGVLSLLVSLLRQLVLILPISWILGTLWGLPALWLAFPISEIFSFLLSLAFLAKIMRTVVNPLAQPPSEQAS